MSGGELPAANKNEEPESSVGLMTAVFGFVGAVVVTTTGFGLLAGRMYGSKDILTGKIGRDWKEKMEREAAEKAALEAAQKDAPPPVEAQVVKPDEKKHTRKKITRQTAMAALQGRKGLLPGIPPLSTKYSPFRALKIATVVSIGSFLTCVGATAYIIDCHDSYEFNIWALKKGEITKRSFDNNLGFLHDYGASVRAYMDTTRFAKWSQQRAKNMDNSDMDDSVTSYLGGVMKELGIPITQEDIKAYTSADPNSPYNRPTPENLARPTRSNDPSSPYYYPNPDTPRSPDGDAPADHPSSE